MHVQFLSRSRRFWDWSRIIPNWWRSSTEIRVLDWLLHAATNQRTAKVHVRVGFRSRYKVNFWPCKHASKSWNLEPSILLNARLFEANLPFLAKKGLVVCFDFVKALNWEHTPFFCGHVFWQFQVYPGSTYCTLGVSNVVCGLSLIVTSQFLGPISVPLY